MNDFTNWTSFEIDALATKFRRHRKFFRSLKLLLPLTALGLTLALIIYPNLYPETKKFVIKPAEVTEAVENPPMLNPRFAGFDKDNQPYSLQAARAYQEKNNKVRLEEISADLTMKNGTWASVITPEGIYDIDNESLVLTDIFEVFMTESNAKTYHLTGTGLEVDMDKQIITSHKRVEVEAPMGSLTAGGFIIRNKLGKISFTGPVKLVIRK